MNRLHFPVRGWLGGAERALLRTLMVIVGLAMMVLGLAMGVTMIMLPVGLIVGFVGVGLVVWGAFGDLPVN
jgi:hypothetical protein